MAMIDKGPAHNAHPTLWAPPAIDRSRPRTVFRANDTGDGASWAGPRQRIEELVGPVHQLVPLECWLQADDPTVRVVRQKIEITVWPIAHVTNSPEFVL
jgi:hypothetical protein